MSRKHLLLGCLLAAALPAWLLARGGGSGEVGRAWERGPAVGGEGPRLTGRSDRASGGRAAALSPPGTPTSDDPGAEDDPALPADRVPLEVEVVDRDGRAVPRARVLATWGEWHTREHVTGEDGRVTVSLPPRSRMLEVHGQAGEPTGDHLFAHYHPLVPGAPSTRVVLRSQREVSGFVERADGGPLGMGVLEARRLATGSPGDEGERAALYRRSQTLAQTVVGPGGEFRVKVPDDAPVLLLYEGVPSLGTRIRAMAADVAPGTQGLRLRAAERLEKAELRLSIVDPQGRPADGARVTHREVEVGKTGSLRLAIRWEGTPEPPPTPVADAHGEIVFRDLDAWPFHVDVVGGRDGDVLRPTAHVVRLPGFAEARVTLEPPPAALRGTVVDRRGKPVPGAWVFATSGSDVVAGFRTDAWGGFDGTSNRPPGTRLQVFARHPMDQPTARGYVEDVIAGRSVTVELEEIGPLTSRPNPPVVVIGIGDN